MSMKESAAHLLKEVPATCPPIALAAHVSGTVVIGAEVNLDGDVTATVPISGPPMLQGAAADAVKQYKYQPFIIDGKAAVVRLAVQVTFYPSHSKSGK